MFIENVNKNLPDIVKNYLELQDVLDVEQLRAFRNLFKKIGSHNLKSVNILTDDLIIDGLVMIPNKKENMHIIEMDFDELIQLINNSLTKNVESVQEAYYMKSLTSLLKNINFINEEEQFLFNSLFEEINFENKHLEEVEQEENKYIIR